MKPLAQATIDPRPKKAVKAPRKPTSHAPVSATEAPRAQEPQSDYAASFRDGTRKRLSSLHAHDSVVHGLRGQELSRTVESFKSVNTKSLLEAIGVSERTAHRIKSEPGKLLDARTSDGIVKLQTLYALAVDVLGSGEAAEKWLDSDAIGLEFRKPIELVRSTPGFDAVKTLLQRMKYGVYA